MSPGRCLLIDDGLRARAVIADGVRVLDVVEVAHAGPATAVPLLVAALRERGHRPRRVAVVDFDVGRTVADLPVAPDHPMPHQQMQALAADALRRHAGREPWSRSLGAILVGMGALEPGQVARILAVCDEDDGHSKDDDLFAEHRPATTRTVRRRFGEAAVHLGMVDEASIERALERQQAQSDEAGDLVCGWQPLGNDEGTERWPWLLTGIPRRRRDAWRLACRRAGWRLEVVVPLFGSAAGCLPPGSSGTLVECEPGLVGITELVDGRTRDCHHHPLRGAVPEPGELVDHLVGCTGPVWTSGRFADDPELRRHLAEVLGCEVVPLEEAHPTATGVLRHLEGAGPDAVQAVIPATDPRPSPLHRPGLWIAAALLIAVGGNLAWYFERRARYAPMDDLIAAKADLERKRDAAAALQQAYDAAVADRETWEREWRSYRVQQQELLDAIAANLGDDMMLEQLSRAGDRVRVVGLSRESPAGGRYQTAVTEGLADSGWRGSSPTVKAESYGYRFEFVLELDGRGRR